MAAYMRQICILAYNKFPDCSRIAVCRAPTVQLALSSNVSQVRSVHLSSWYQKEKKATEGEEDESEEKKEAVDESKKRPVIDVQTSIRYLNSKAYKLTYGDALVWEPYRRNHKGSLPPEKTRKTCIRGGVISTGNPCPICRDEYLVLHPENVKLLKQFISPYTGQLISYQKTGQYPEDQTTKTQRQPMVDKQFGKGVCQMQHKNLLVAVQQAWDHGYIDMPVPFRKYDYQEYYPNMKSQEEHV